VSVLRVSHAQGCKRRCAGRLNDDDVPVLCSRRKAREWRQGKANRCCVKENHVAGWRLYTTFNWYSLAPDGPPLFWKVSCMRISAPFESRERFFGTKEAALELHGLCAAALARGHTGVTCL